MVEFNRLDDTSFPAIDTVDPYQLKVTYDFSKFKNAQMRIRLLNVPWDLGSVHVGQKIVTGIGNVVYFESAQARDEWFNSKRYAASADEWATGNYDGIEWITDYRRYHADDEITLPVPFDALAQFNYLVIDYFVSPVPDSPVDFEDAGIRTWYYFIRNIRMKAVSSTVAEIYGDLWTTYIYDMTITSMVLEQGHAPMAGISADDYLRYPIGNTKYLLDDDESYGELQKVAHSSSAVLNAGDMWAVVVSTSSLADEWGSAQSDNWHVPSPAAYVAHGVPSFYAIAVEPSELYRLLFECDRLIPQFKQTVKGVFFVSKALVTAQQAFEFSGVSCRLLMQKNSEIPILRLDKSQFGYPAQYADIAKLYTYPYSAIEITDESGDVSLIKVEDTTGSLDLQLASSVAFPYVSLDGRITGVGGGGHNQITFRDVTQHSFDFSGRWYEHIRKWDIPVFAITQNAAIENYFREYYQREQQLLENETAYGNALRSAQTGYDNALASNATSNTNALASNATTNTNTLASNTTAYDNATDRAQTGYDNARASNATANANALASNATTNANALASNQTAYDNATDSAQTGYDNALASNALAYNSSTQTNTTNNANTLASNQTAYDNATDRAQTGYDNALASNLLAYSNATQTNATANTNTLASNTAANANALASNLTSYSNTVNSASTAYDNAVASNQLSHDNAISADALAYRNATASSQTTYDNAKLTNATTYSNAVAYNLVAKQNSDADADTAVSNAEFQTASNSAIMAYNNYYVHENYILDSVENTQKTDNSNFYIDATTNAQILADQQSTGISAVSGIASSAVSGAAMGSVVPGVGTAVGAVGGLVSGIASAAMSQIQLEVGVNQTETMAGENKALNQANTTLTNDFNGINLNSPYTTATRGRAGLQRDSNLDSNATINANITAQTANSSATVKANATRTQTTSNSAALSAKNTSDTTAGNTRETTNANARDTKDTSDTIAANTQTVNDDNALATKNTATDNASATKTTADANANRTKAAADANANRTKATADGIATATKATGDANALRTYDTDNDVATRTKGTADANANRTKATADGIATATKATDDANSLRTYDTENDIATRTKGTADANANRTKATADANANRDKATGDANALRTYRTANANALASKNTSDAGVQAGIDAAALNAPFEYGTFEHGETALTRPMGLFANIVTQSDSAITLAGDNFLRYGYRYHGAWQFDGDFNVMPKFTFWKCSDVWIKGLNMPDEHVDYIRFLLIGGVTVWSDPDFIGNTSIYEND